MKKKWIIICFGIVLALLVIYFIHTKKEEREKQSYYQEMKLVPTSVEGADRIRFICSFGQKFIVSQDAIDMITDSVQHMELSYFDWQGYQEEMKGTSGSATTWQVIGLCTRDNSTPFFTIEIGDESRGVAYFIDDGKYTYACKKHNDELDKFFSYYWNLLRENSS